MEVNNISSAQAVPQDKDVKEVKIEQKVDLSDPVDTAEFSGSVDGEAVTTENNKSKKKVDWFAVMFPSLSLLGDKKYKTEAAFLGAGAGILALSSHFGKALQQLKFDESVVNYIVAPMKKKIPGAKIGYALTAAAGLGLSVLHSFVANKHSVNQEEK